MGEQVMLVKCINHFYPLLSTIFLLLCAIIYIYKRSVSRKFWEIIFFHGTKLSPGWEKKLIFTISNFVSLDDKCEILMMLTGADVVDARSTMGLQHVHPPSHYGYQTACPFVGPRRNMGPMDFLEPRGRPLRLSLSRSLLFSLSLPVSTLRQLFPLIFLLQAGNALRLV